MINLVSIVISWSLPILLIFFSWMVCKRLNCKFKSSSAISLMKTVPFFACSILPTDLEIADKENMIDPYVRPGPFRTGSHIEISSINDRGALAEVVCIITQISEFKNR